MRKVCWAAACVAAGAGLALACMWMAHRAVVARLPYLAEMTTGCGVAGAAPRSVPAFVTPATCRRYFADVAVLRRTAAAESVGTGLIAAFLLAVLRFRVYPLGRARAVHAGEGGPPPTAPP